MREMQVSDRPGGIAELARAISAAGVSIKDMVHERAWIKNDIFSVEVGRNDVVFPYLDSNRDLPQKSER